jgi:hypothetical protein
MTVQAYQPSDYRSYLLRLWRADGDGEPVWRASLEDAVSGERRGFATVEALAPFCCGWWARKGWRRRGKVGDRAEAREPR